MLHAKTFNQILLSKITCTRSQRPESLISRNIFIRVLFVSAFSNTFLKQVMSWRCSGQTNEELVGNLKSKFFLLWLNIYFLENINEPWYNNTKIIVNLSFFIGQGILNNEETVKAMLSVDRKNYAKAKSVPYQDAPQGIGYGVTISAPHMVIIIIFYRRVPKFNQFYGVLFIL